MNDTPRSERLHIALFGRRNAGKSSLINALTNQQVAVVSEVPGTTTDPVYKSMEVSQLGPVVFIDTPGTDDWGILGKLRIEKTKQVLRKTDIAILVMTNSLEWGEQEDELTREFNERNIPFIIAMNKCDCNDNKDCIINIKEIENLPVIKTSALTGQGIEELIDALVRLENREDDNKLHLVDGIVKTGDMVVLVTPIDKAAPKGRIILPQQQVIRDILDNNAIALVVKETELEQVLDRLTYPPSIVITDSQVFDKVNVILPENIPLTSFSIIYARQKGDLELFGSAVKEIENLKDNDRILMAEGCTHHRKDDDIGTVKIPKLLKEKTGKELIFDYVSGGFFGEDISRYKMIIHCGACMLNKKEMEYRQVFSINSGVPMINYGIILAYLHGILDRALKPFENELKKKGV